MVQDKIFEHRPISELMAIVKGDFKKFDAEGLIDEGSLIKTVMYANDKLGILVREIREIAVDVENYKAKLPLDFEKLYYACALKATNTATTFGRNPFDNSFDSDVIYEAKLDRDSLGCVDNYRVEIIKDKQVTIHNYGTWVQLEVGKNSAKHCHTDCPLLHKKGKYEIEIHDGHIHTSFRSGTIYLMYIGMMRDENGEITFPFHPMITPYYEWAIKEKILEDAVFNSDATNIGELYKLAEQKRKLAWLDAFNFSMEEPFNDFQKRQRKKELTWYNQYFKFFQ